MTDFGCTLNYLFVKFLDNIYVYIYNSVTNFSGGKIMKKTKKLLSLVLAIIMVMAVSPMALAYNFDTNAFKEMVVGFADYIHNIYEPVGDMSSDDIRS